MAWGVVRSGRSLDRLINFSDAVVAVAITILALPLVEIPGPGPGETMLDVLGANFGQIQTFVLTFIVVGIMWSVHNKIVNHLGAYDTAIFWLFILLLIGFAFLPWPSRLYESPGFVHPTMSDPSQNGAAALYWLTLAYISFIGAATSFHMSRHPDLIAPDDLANWKAIRSSRARWRGSAFTAVFILAAFVSLFVYWAGNYVLLLFIPLGIYLRTPTPAPAQQQADT